MTLDAADATGGPFAGLVVIDLSTTLPGAQATQFLADGGADVLMVEAPGGSPLRDLPGWPALLRGKRSVTLDVKSEEGRDDLRALLVGADVLVTTMRPSSADAMGFTAEALAEKFPRLVTALITGWGADSPFRHYKGWEGLITAKSGVMYGKRQLTVRPGPAYVSTPYASFAAGQSAVHGILAALIERETSGLGQLVEADLVRGIGSMDTYNWFYEMVLHRYPGAYTPMDVAYDDNGKPQAFLIYALLIAATKDGTWLQFAQTAPRLMQAWLVELDLAKELADPKWAGFPMLPTAELRTEWWTLMLERVRARTFEEWQHVFETNHDVAAESFRTPADALDHPQVVFDGRATVVDDPDLGPVRQPSTMIHSNGKPLTRLRPAPRVGEQNDRLDELIARAAERRAAAGGEAVSGLPLAGTTIVEFGAMFAGPYGATLLADLGARVIKIEPLEGDNIRQLVAFPEAGGAKVLQGKESVAIDFGTPEGLAAVHEIVRTADVVLQCYRGGVAERAKVDEATLKAINPDLVYLSAPGYGVDGPYAARPAYAPSIGAASGISATDGRDITHPMVLEEIQASAMTLHAAGATNAAQSDGVSALGVATALLTGMYAKQRGIELPGMVTTMLGTCHQALITHNTTYAGRPDNVTCDEEFYGTSALYRLYPAASDGWVFLAAPAEKEWDELVAALAPYVDLAGDERFATPQARADNDAILIEVLGAVFAKRDKADWEAELTSQNVGCVAAADETAEWVMQDDEFYEAGYAVDAVSPIFDEHRRLAPLTRFSRSLTKADAGCTIGQHTESVLAEIGYDGDRIAQLRDQGVIG